MTHEPVVMRYREAHRKLVKPCELLEGRGSRVLVERGRRYSRHSYMRSVAILPAGTAVALEKIVQIQGDGFVLFEATGRVFPQSDSTGITFQYRWGHGGTSPQAPWEQSDQRLKQLLSL